MDTAFINHRRDRQHARRILADIRIRYRDLTRSSFHEDIDPIGDQPRRLLVFPRLAFMRNRH